MKVTDSWNVDQKALKWPGLLEILEDLREVVDLLLVSGCRGSFIVILPEAFGRHAGVDEAMSGSLNECDVSLEVAVEQRRPRVELATDRLFVCTERVGVVVARDHRQPLGRAVAKCFFELSRKIFRNGASPCPGGTPGLERAVRDEARVLAERGHLSTGIGMRFPDGPD